MSRTFFGSKASSQVVAAHQQCGELLDHFAMGDKPGQWTANTRARVAEQAMGVKHWGVYDDAFSALLKFMGVSTWFIDPPYQYNYNYGKKPLFSYYTLGETIRSKQGQLIVCEAICPKTGAIPDWLPFEFWGSRITSRRKANNNHHSKELIWVRP